MEFSQRDSATPKPWYQQFWPWFIIALPATAVIGGVITLVIAASNPDSLVADDYYKEGLAINQALEKEQHAAALGLSGLLRLEPEAGRVVIALLHDGGFAQPTRLALQLTHPTRPNLDQSLTLNREAADRWSGDLDLVVHGRWHVRVESPNGDWRLNGRINVPDELQGLLQP